jgi:hypothetical protein
MEFGIRNVAFVIEMNTDLGVALDAGHGINENAF